MTAKAASFAGDLSRTPVASAPSVRWRPAVDHVHSISATLALSATAVLALVSPLAGAALQSWSGAALLVGGALIGVPHGSSDFVVAHRLMRPALGRCWLPCFLVAYLALVAMAMAAWALVPLATLLGFLAISALHFGRSDIGTAAPTAHRALGFVVRATTPVLPIFLVHAGDIAGVVAVLGGVPQASALHLLASLRAPLLLPWSLALAAVTLTPLLTASRITAIRDACELLGIALAAVVLPPLLAFGLYFCLVHAVRHMLDLAEDRHPKERKAAALLVAGIVLPSALACVAALCLTWDGLAGLHGTDALVTWSLRGVAALTVPHMILEWAASRRVDAGLDRCA